MPFRAVHFNELILQSAQEHCEGLLTPEKGLEVEASGVAFTAVGDGKVIACAGIITFWPGRAQAWALMSKDAGPYAVKGVAAMRRFLELHKVRRMEMTVAHNFDEGHRLAHLLGFKWESYMPCYGINGANEDMYVRIER